MPNDERTEAGCCSFGTVVVTTSRHLIVPWQNKYNPYKSDTDGGVVLFLVVTVPLLLSRGAGHGGAASPGAALPLEENEEGRAAGPAPQDHPGLLLQPQPSTGTLGNL